MLLVCVFYAGVEWHFLVYAIFGLVGVGAVQKYMLLRVNNYPRYCNIRMIVFYIDYMECLPYVYYIGTMEY